MTQTIPREPVALMAARIAIGLMLLLVVLAFLPRQAGSAAPPVQAQVRPITIVVTATPRAAPEPPAPAQAPLVQQAAPTAATVAAIGDPPSQIVHNADGSVSLPGSEAWMPEQPAVTNADPQLQTLRDAAAAYQQLPVAAPPSLENAQPNYSRRPHTGR